MLAIDNLESLARGPWSASQVRVHWNGPANRICDAAETYLNARWNTYVQDAEARGGRLFNGSITCLAGYSQEHDALYLHLYQSDYRRFLVTTVRDRAWFAAHAPEAITPALGNSALVTGGSVAVLGVRSPRVAAYAGHAHLIGGAMDALAAPDLPPTAEGIVTHLQRELAEELGLTEGDLAPAPTLLGLFRDTHLAQPELVWHWPLRAGAAGVAHLARQMDASEHTYLHMVERDSDASASPPPLTPMAQAALACWRALP